ncbi:hypothetical protein F4780DRAFT_753411 [Xylariomycetidae sp. FL0641]|nr:hypothetical protein F4780DRAFT_753411 [Xylariomycetidae sp. FL0641]
MGSGSNTSFPRSVADATRFTASSPHARTKPASPSASSASSSSSSPSSKSAASQPSARRPPVASSSSPQETLEQRVRRLRAAHLAAKQHELSRFDRVVDWSRKYFDAAHKITVTTLIGFSGLALFVTIYATADMALHNRARRNEFFALQKQLREDSLEAARLAYMTGKATPEQAALVEEATAAAKAQGLSLPPLLSAPQTAAPAGGRTETEETVGRTAWPGESMVESNIDAEAEPKTKGGITGWLFGGLKKDEVDPASASASAAPHDFVAEGAAASGRSVADKAKAAFAAEKDNQRHGGMLDQLGLEEKAKETPPPPPAKKGWLW